MFDFMIRILPNNRLLVRNNDSKESKVLKPSEISSYFENVLEAQFEAQKADEDKIAEIKEKAKASNDKKGS